PGRLGTERLLLFHAQGEPVDVRPRLVAALLDGGDDVAIVDAAVGNDDPRPLRGEADAGLDDALDPRHRLLHAAHATGAVHALDIVPAGHAPDLEARLRGLLEDARRRRGAVVEGDVGPGQREADVSRLDAVDCGESLLQPRGTAGTVHALDSQARTPPFGVAPGGGYHGRGRGVFGYDLTGIGHDNIPQIQIVVKTSQKSSDITTTRIGPYR